MTLEFEEMYSVKMLISAHGDRIKVPHHAFTLRSPSRSSPLFVSYN